MELASRTVSRRVVFALIIALPIAGILIGSIGNLGGGGSTTTVNATVMPAEIGLKPGKTASVSVLINNTNDYGVRVASIEASESQPADGCPGGVLTSEELSDPSGYIKPNDVNAFPVTVTLKDNAADGCLKQTLTLPLTVELVSRKG